MDLWAFALVGRNPQWAQGTVVLVAHVERDGGLWKTQSFPVVLHLVVIIFEGLLQVYVLLE